MKKTFIVAMLTTAMMGLPAFAASDTNYSNSQQPQGAQTQNDQTSAKAQQNNGKAQQDTKYQSQPSNQQSAAKDQENQQQSAQNSQPISPQSLPRSEIRQVQQALDKDGFKAGTADGRWGPKTEDAVKQFQQSKQIQANGQLDQQTVSDLGLDTSRFSQSRGNQK